MGKGLLSVAVPPQAVASQEFVQCVTGEPIEGRCLAGAAGERAGPTATPQRGQGCAAR